MNSRKEQIENFAAKWNEMLEAANAIEGFTWKFSVGITSKDSLVADRVKTINLINEAFTNNNMNWSSTNG